MLRSPLFEVVTPASGAAARRLTTAAKVQSRLGIGAIDTTTIEDFIDGVSANAARYCGLAYDAAGTPRTFGREDLKATWFAQNYSRLEYGSTIFLPWRLPITAISIVECGVTLTENTDFVLRPACMVDRLCDGRALGWSGAGLVIEYTAGWVLPDNVPAEIESYVIDQVKMQYLNRKKNDTIRQEAVPNVYSASYSVAGGDSISENGLLKPLEAALDSFRLWTAV